MLYGITVGSVIVYLTLIWVASLIPASVPEERSKIDINTGEAAGNISVVDRDIGTSSAPFVYISVDMNVFLPRLADTPPGWIAASYYFGHHLRAFATALPFAAAWALRP